jgi:methionine-rich copper-binding protein CopC
MLLRTAARSSARALLVVTFALLAAIGSAGPASAHATLIGSDPADGAVVQTAPTVVTLTFDDSLQDFEPVLTVTGPDGTQYQTGAATIDGVKLSTTVAALPVGGSYTVAYRVVSDDGHPVEGQTHFELALPAGSGASTGASADLPVSTVSVPPTVTTVTDPAVSTSSGGWSAWQWLIVALVVVLAFGGAMIVRRRMQANARSGSGGDER